MGWNLLFATFKLVQRKYACTEGKIKMWQNTNFKSEWWAVGAHDKIFGTTLTYLLALSPNKPVGTARCWDQQSLRVNLVVFFYWEQTTAPSAGPQRHRLLLRRGSKEASL